MRAGINNISVRVVLPDAINVTPDSIRGGIQTTHFPHRKPHPD